MNQPSAIQNQIPQISEKIIHRDRLFQQLKAGLKTRLTLVSAPAGYGKTVLVAQWLRLAAVDCGWLTIDEKEPGLQMFWQQVVFSLRTVQPEFGQEILEVLQQNSQISIDLILNGLIAEIEKVKKPICLVLDDYFHIQSPSIHQSLRFLLEHCPNNLHIVLLTRLDPPLPLARFRAREQMVDIRGDDLRFNESETKNFLECIGIPSISSNAIAMLYQRTEGWAAGIQLSGLAIKKQTNPEVFIAAFSGSQRYIFDYLTDEVLCNLSEDQQEFLLKTSILRQLNGPICMALVESENAPAILEQLYQQNVFLQLIDESQEWFRYHGLFRDVLQSRLKRAYSPESIKHLHRLASAWYQQAGWGQEALQHAMTAHDLDRVGELIETMTELLTWSSGFHTDLIKILEQLPESVFQSHPRLQLLYARSLLLNGQGQEGELRLKTIERQISQLNSTNEDTRHYLGMIFTHRATRFALSGEITEARRLAIQALEYLPSSDLLSCAQAIHTLGLASDTEGKIRQAAGYFQQASLQALQTNHRNLAVVSASQQAFSEIGFGELRQAETTTRLALHWAQIGSTELPIAAYAHTALAEIFRQQNHLNLAEHEINRALYLAEKAIPPVRWHAALVQANIRFSQHDLSGALSILQQSEVNFRHILPKHFTETTHACLCRVWVAQKRADLARDWFEEQKIQLSDPVYYLDPNHEGQILILCRAQIEAGEKESVQKQLQTLYETAFRQEHKVVLMETLLLLALSAENLPSAYTYLKEAIILAEPHGYQRIFLDEGRPCFDLLQNFRQRSKIHLPFVDELINAYQQEWINAKKGESQPSNNSEIEFLTGRELDVLTQIAHGASNQQIADHLVVSIHTVKKHAANIFIKLGVENRTEAVAHARLLGLL
jgi:LuxR family maltose regulon positive regulatory protein